MSDDFFDSLMDSEEEAKPSRKRIKSRRSKPKADLFAETTWNDEDGEVAKRNEPHTDERSCYAGTAGLLSELLK